MYKILLTNATKKYLQKNKINQNEFINYIINNNIKNTFIYNNKKFILSNIAYNKRYVKIFIGNYEYI